MPATTPWGAIIVDDEALARRRLAALLAPNPSFRVLAECAGGREAVRALSEFDADLVFLDIQMPEMDGFEVLRAVPAERLPLVIFVTAHDEYAIRAFEASALDYLLKPFRRQRLEQALERAHLQLSLMDAQGFRRRVEGLLALRGGSRLAVRTGRTTLILDTAAIDWIEAANNYSCLHCAGSTHVVREKLASFETRLRGARFVRIHRSVIVNASRVREVRPWLNGDHRVVLADGTELTLSRTHADRMDLLLGGVAPGRATRVPLSRAPD